MDMSHFKTNCHTRFSAAHPLFHVYWLLDEANLYLSSADKTRPKIVFSVGDHVRFHNSRFGRVDAVFVFDCMGIHRHIFVVLTELRQNGRRDHLLDLDVLDDEDQPIIVGLPAIDPVKLYMIPVDGIGTIFNDWDVYYL